MVVGLLQALRARVLQADSKLVSHMWITGSARRRGGVRGSRFLLTYQNLHYGSNLWYSIQWYRTGAHNGADPPRTSSIDLQSASRAVAEAFHGPSYPLVTWARLRLRLGSQLCLPTCMLVCRRFVIRRTRVSSPINTARVTLSRNGTTNRYIHHSTSDY